MDKMVKAYILVVLKLCAVAH